MFKQATVALSLLACGAAAYAAEENLDFKLITMPAEVTQLNVPNVPGQALMTGKFKGAAFFKDGRIAAKDFILVQDHNKGTGHAWGYSTYQFEDGSTIVARFEIKLTAGKPYHGDYTVLSGTGKYQGVSGTGSFDFTPTKLEGAFLQNGTFKLTTP